jgi:DNA-binding NtrC family response regulator
MMADNEGTRVLVVDDDDKLRNTSKNLLLKAGFVTDVAVDGIEGIEMVRTSDYDVVLLDFQMPELDGIETLKRMKQIRPEVIIIMMTAYASRDNADEAISFNAYHYVSKPFDLKRVIQLIDDAKQAKAAVEEVAISGAHLEVDGAPKVFDAEDPIRDAFFLVNEANRGDLPVVILGEPGTGRELFAEVLHKNSARKSKRFITFTCHGIDRNNLEVRLFGREGGGAEGRREIGALEQSSGGTLLVQDIPQAEPDFTKRLLEAITTGTFTRLDGNKSLKINTRLMVSLSLNMADDLEGEGPLGGWARLARPHRILLEPLRNRRHELPHIFATLLRRQATVQGKSIVGFTDEAIECLTNYDWPGNIREASNIIDNALLREQGEQITTASLPGLFTDVAPETKEETYQEAMVSFERNYFRQLLDEHQGDLEQVASHAHLTVEQLLEKLKQLKVDI